jgi:quercetin dioxygenase-like cupin family protein
MNLKLMSAGILVGCAVGVIALSVARATPGQGVTATVIAGPVALDEIDIKGNTDDHKVKIQTRGEWESRVVHFQVVPGAHFGWHSHPGPVFVHITAGTLTFEAADAAPVDYPAGTGFVDFGDVHDARNEGTQDVEIVAFFLTPAGAPIRTDEPQP